ncbi:BA75_05101T0 [Komagataella pastoris]|uniref:HECT-type E3 ubiquitin transferase n=1 Tax=Komagataella pastoris TaxID=4922 RepID=A0A1B2JI84_PICPA|nr:BA75_05101T0 [Komagataella pastoris]
MFNFDGSTKRRNVNLSGRRSNLESREQLLHRAELERNRRKEARLQDKSVRVIQSYVRTFLLRNHVSLEFEKMWLHCGNDATALNMFAFFSPNLVLKRDEAWLQVQLDHVSMLLSSPHGSISFLLRNALVEVLFKTSKQGRSPLPILKLVNTLCHKFAIDWSQSRDLIGKLVDRLGENEELDLQILKFTFNVRDNDMETFASAFIIIVQKASLNDEAKQLIREHFSHPSSFYLQLPNPLFFQYLLSIITIWKKYDGVENVDIFLAQELSSAVEAMQELKFCFENELSQDLSLNKDTNIGGRKDLVITADSKEALLYLYSPDYQTKISNLPNVSTEFLSNFYYSLLVPIDTGSPQNEEILNSLLISVVVNGLPHGILHYWLQQIVSSDIFRLEDGNWGLNKPILTGCSAELWQTLHIFLDVYFYVLNMSSDSVIFDQGRGRLPQDEFLKVVSFLKVFCVTLVLKDKELKPSLPSSTRIMYDKTLSVALKLLHQIYLRNLRLSFVPEEYWLCDLTLSVEQIVPVLYERDISLSNNTDFDLDQDTSENLNPESDFSQLYGLNSTRYMKLPTSVLAALKVLKFLPFMFSFTTRATILHQLIRQSQEIRDTYGGVNRIQGTISRDNIIEDGFALLSRLTGEQLKNHLGIQFTNQFGAEAGIDGGGLTKEFLTETVKKGFATTNESGVEDLMLFKHSPRNEIYPNPALYLKRSKGINVHKDLEMIRYLGSIVGKCLYEKILVDLPFSPFFLTRWSVNQPYKTMFDDLKYYDEDLFRNLNKLLSLSSAQVDALELNFTLTERFYHNGAFKTTTIMLLPNGATIPVTTANRLQYVFAVSNFKLYTSLRLQTDYFLQGLFKVIPSQWLEVFNPMELQILVSGRDRGIDISDLKKNTVFSEYSENDQTIIDLFDILEHDFSNEERSQFIRFVTSSSKAPLLGFSQLNPKFGVRNIGPFSDRLPSAFTCFNQLKLPNYGNRKVLKEKLLYAISSESGFDLS